MLNKEALRFLNRKNVRQELGDKVINSAKYTADFAAYTKRSNAIWKEDAARIAKIK